MKKLVISLTTLLLFLVFTVQNKSYAYEVNSIENIDNYIIVRDNQFELDKIPVGMDNAFIDQVKNILKKENEHIRKNDLIIDPTSKRITDRYSRFLRMNEDSEYYWWGVRHIFYSDEDAREYSHEMTNMAYSLEIASVPASVLGPWASGAVAISGGVVGLIAESVDYNASLDGDGVILDLNWWSTFACYPR